MTLPPLGISVGEVSAATDCDVQTGGVGVVCQGQLQLSCYTAALKEAALCADAAAAALGEQTTKCNLPFLRLKGTSRIVIVFQSPFWEHCNVSLNFQVTHSAHNRE